MELFQIPLDQLKPYPNNPRYNDDAIDAVTESIDQVGYITPIIVDENLQILAGHSRWKSLHQIGEEIIDVILVQGLTEEQKRKFRLLDNKTAEIATWDLDKLQKELDSSEFLIVICSPDTCGSRWVKEEIVYFLEHHQTSELLPVISAGDPQKVLSSIFRGIQ